MKRWIHSWSSPARSSRLASACAATGRGSIPACGSNRSVPVHCCSHAWLDNNCAACHSPVKSGERAKCIGCHANNTALLQRQPTAFHASIGDAAAATSSIRGQPASPPMDHVAREHRVGRCVEATRTRLTTVGCWPAIRSMKERQKHAPTHPGVTSTEAALDCLTCHSTKDRHQGYFGGDCASCHRTTSWAIAEFQHPSPRSVECVQCHQPPPSHSMMHFTMVSQSVAEA